jgi:N6-L-threonylcarbamoyladenine synthase
VPALLAIETSCDETSVAIVRDGAVLSNVVSSQMALHAKYGGVVPELATREHLRNFLPVARAALREAGVDAGELDAIAATLGPGLPNALMIGCRAAQALAFALDRPFLGIHHHEAHLLSPWVRVSLDSPDSVPPRLAADFQAFQPNVSLIVSGGHTLLVHADAPLRHRVLGSTVDDAAGECFDKVAKLLGLAYPGGPELNRIAAQGNPRAHDFPRPMLREAHDDFSFSGLKTAVRYYLRDHPDVLSDAQRRRDVAASAQAAIVDVLVAKTVRAALRLGVNCVTASGGVTCNSVLRRQLAAACAERGLTLRLTPRELCTDNAAMIGLLAGLKLAHGATPTDLDAATIPGWELAMV